MIETVPYEPSLREAWDTLVDHARNGHFLFRRDYLEYHADRFPDASYLFRENGRWLGLVAGHRLPDGGWATHHGLTFGGLVVGREARASQVRDMLNGLHAHLASLGVTSVRYRPMPWFHQSETTQEDAYFLFRLGARIVYRTLCTIVRPEDAHLNELRRRSARKGEKAGLRVERSHDWDAFWNVLSGRLLARYGARPVHTLDEIKLLASRFPDQIQLWAAFEEGDMRGGIVGYRTPNVFHMQYSGADERGRELGATDLVLREVLAGPARTSRWFSFGTSCERDGNFLNDTLVSYKESFGGRGAVHEEYEYVPGVIPVDEARLPSVE